MGFWGLVCVHTPNFTDIMWKSVRDLPRCKEWCLRDKLLIRKSGAESFPLRSVCYSVSSPQLQILGFINRTVGKMLSQNHQNPLWEKRSCFFLAPPGRSQAGFHGNFPASPPVSLSESRIPAMGWAKSVWQLWLWGFRELLEHHPEVILKSWAKILHHLL